MAYIQPNSTIQLYSDLSLSPSYDDTLYFSNTGSKDEYFSNIYGTYGVATCNAMSYSRETRGFVRVELPMSTCYSATYMRFKNTSFENKWFYAFVKSVEYINNVTTQINFELDYIMTWMGDFTLGQCYVERQHVRNDAIGANIADEGISCGSYVVEGYQDGNNWGKGDCVIRLQYANPEEAQASSVGGIYNPTVYVDSIDAGHIARAINELVDKNLSDNVLNVYMCPTEFQDTVGSNIGTISVSKPYNSVAGYVPKNNKLFCYPYKYLTVNNGEGDSKDYKYEFFNGVPDEASTGDCGFIYQGISANGVRVGLYPEDYNNGVNSTLVADTYNGLTMTHFPTCAWTYDTYKAQLAQENAYFEQTANKQLAHGVVNIASSAAKGAIYGGLHSSTQKGIVGTGITGSTIGAATGAASGGLSAAVDLGASMADLALDNLIDNTIQPESGSTTGGTLTADLGFSVSGKKFRFYKMSITKNYAMMIDDYFTMYGYKVKQVMTPNMHARTNWTYVKTIGCIVHGHLPADHAKVIESIFDRGVRFWMGVNMIGNYDLDNSPV